MWVLTFNRQGGSGNFGGIQPTEVPRIQFLPPERQKVSLIVAFKRRPRTPSSGGGLGGSAFRRRGLGLPSDDRGMRWVALHSNLSGKAYLEPHALTGFTC